MTRIKPTVASTCIATYLAFTLLLPSRALADGAVPLVSAKTTGEPANSYSEAVTISGDGTHIVFGSCAYDLVEPVDSPASSGIVSSHWLIPHPHSASHLAATALQISQAPYRRIAVRAVAGS